MIGTPHTRRVGHTFPLVNVRVRDNKTEFETCEKMCLFFFLFLNSLGNHHVTAQGGPRPDHSLALGVRAKENTVYPPKPKCL